MISDFWVHEEKDPTLRLWNKYCLQYYGGAVDIEEKMMQTLNDSEMSKVTETMKDGEWHHVAKANGHLFIDGVKT